MKELSFEKMESLNGGNPLPYCALLEFWLRGGAGYQGDPGDLQNAYNSHCR